SGLPGSVPTESFQSVITVAAIFSDSLGVWPWVSITCELRSNDAKRTLLTAFINPLIKSVPLPLMSIIDRVWYKSPPVFREPVMENHSTVSQFIRMETKLIVCAALVLLFGMTFASVRAQSLQANVTVSPNG